MYGEKRFLSAKAIYDKEFKYDARGYRPQEVDQFLDTIIHEGRHAYQRYNVDIKCIHESASEVKQWEKNFYDPEWGYYSYRGQKIYIPFSDGKIHDVGFRLYANQPVEIDARNFASDVLVRLEGKGIVGCSLEER